MADRCNRCLDAGFATLIPMWGRVHWCRECALAYGGLVGRRAVAAAEIGADPEAYTPAVLKKLAEGGIMDANALFLPAGKLSKAEADARERNNVETPA